MGNFLGKHQFINAYHTDRYKIGLCNDGRSFINKSVVVAHIYIIYYYILTFLKKDL